MRRLNISAGLLSTNRRKLVLMIGSGCALSLLSQRGEGIAELNRAIALDPTLASAHLNLAVAYTANGEVELATREAHLALLYALPDSDEAGKAKAIFASP
jgi:Flp pilus assembly protein TadD